MAMTYIENTTVCPIILRDVCKNDVTGESTFKIYTVPAGKLATDNGILLLTHQTPQNYGRLDIDADILQRLLGNTNIRNYFLAGRLKSPVYKDGIHKKEEPDVSARKDVENDLANNKIKVEVAPSGERSRRVVSADR